MRKMLSIILLSVLITLIAGCSRESAPGPPADETAPATPTNLSATPVSPSQINLSWEAATDDVAVVGYKIYRGGAYLKSVTGVTVSDTGLSANTSYCYTVSSYDAANNESPKSAPSCATIDTTAPATPANLHATATSAGQINLSWEAATDNVGVAGYKIYRGGAYLKSVTGVTASDTGLSSSTSYCYKVSAFDAANIDSSQSSEACATTHYTIQLGTISVDVAHDVAVDADGNVYVTGYTQGGLDGNTNAGSSDIFLVKYDPAGTKQWTRQLGTTSVEVSEGIAVDTSGNVYVTGYTLGGLDGNTNAGGNDLFLVKYNSEGTKQWTRQLGTTSDDGGYGVAVDAGGNVYVTGYTLGSLDGNANAGGYDIFLVKYDSTGTKQWTRQLGTPSSDIAQDVAVDADGNVYVTGYVLGGLDGNTNVGGFDVVLVKYNAAGTKQWTQQLGTTSDDGGYGVAVDTGGNIYVIGGTLGDLDGNTNAGLSDVFLVKYNAAGTKQWTRQLGTASGDGGYGVAVDTDGNVYVTGYTFGGLDGNTYAGSSDVFLVKYNSAGTKQWTRQLGTTSDDYGEGIAVDTVGNLYITGYTLGGLDGKTSAGSSDVFLVKYNTDGVKQ